MLKSFEIETILIYGLIKDLEIAKKYLDEQRHINLSIKGSDLIEMGFEQSKKISEVLDAVMQYKLENSDLTHAQELDIAKNFM